MNFYVCVYRQPILAKKDCKRANKNAASNDALREYLRRYKNRFKKNKRSQGRFYDWGDDPAFFAAEHFLGNVNGATWGVCRPNVRRKLCQGDVVVFFCAQQQQNREKWKYYYVGIGTVSEVVKGHKRVWSKGYKAYRKFYNLLVDKKGVNREKINYHAKWRELSEGDYIIFDEDSGKTHFNITNPLHVATYTNGSEPWKGTIMEHWNLDNKRVESIYGLVPKRDGGKKLRTSCTGNAHAHMNLSRLGDKLLRQKRQKFLKISKDVARARSKK